MPRPATVDPIVEKVVKHLRDEVGVERIGGVGYCFGGKYVVRWLKGNKSGLDAGYVAHPSFVDREEVEGVKGPLSIAAAREYILNILTRFMEGDCNVELLTQRYELQKPTTSSPPRSATRRKKLWVK